MGGSSATALGDRVQGAGGRHRDGGARGPGAEPVAGHVQTPEQQYRRPDERARPEQHRQAHDLAAGAPPVADAIVAVVRSVVPGPVRGARDSGGLAAGAEDIAISTY